MSPYVENGLVKYLWNLAGVYERKKNSNYIFNWCDSAHTFCPTYKQMTYEKLLVVSFN